MPTTDRHIKAIAKLQAQALGHNPTNFKTSTSCVFRAVCQNEGCKDTIIVDMGDTDQIGGDASREICCALKQKQTILKGIAAEYGHDIEGGFSRNVESTPRLWQAHCSCGIIVSLLVGVTEEVEISSDRSGEHEVLRRGLIGQGNLLEGISHDVPSVMSVLDEHLADDDPEGVGAPPIEEIEAQMEERWVGDEGKILCGDRLHAKARRLCGSCGQSWADNGGPEPSGCGTLLETLPEDEHAGYEGKLEGDGEVDQGAFDTSATNTGRVHSKIGMRLHNSPPRPGHLMRRPSGMAMGLMMLGVLPPLPMPTERRAPTIEEEAAAAEQVAVVDRPPVIRREEIAPEIDMPKPDGCSRSNPTPARWHTTCYTKNIEKQRAKAKAARKARKKMRQRSK